MKNVVIIVAGGKGKRMGMPKQFIKIAGKPMLAWTLSAFQKSSLIDGIVLVVVERQYELANKLNQNKIIKIVIGGKERQDSVRNGLKAVPDSAELILIHDGARPTVSQKIIADSIREAKRFGAVVVAVPVKDTIKQITNDERLDRLAVPREVEGLRMTNDGIFIEKTLDRDLLWAAQTPQVFKSDIIKKAYENLRENVTDDGMAVEKIGIQVKIVLGDYSNLKVTTPEDIAVAGSILKKRGK